MPCASPAARVLIESSCLAQGRYCSGMVMARMFLLLLALISTASASQARTRTLKYLQHLATAQYAEQSDDYAKLVVSTRTFFTNSSRMLRFSEPGSYLSPAICFLKLSPSLRRCGTRSQTVRLLPISGDGLLQEQSVQTRSCSTAEKYRFERSDGGARSTLLARGDLFRPEVP